MDLFLFHCLMLGWLSIGSARRVTVCISELLLTAALLAWGNLVVTCFSLSVFHLLGNRMWFLGISALVAVATYAWMRCVLCTPCAPVTVGPKPARWLVGLLIPALTVLAGAAFALAYAYGPNNPDALSYQLPRAVYYLGQNSLAHFDAADLRQTQLPFNYNILQLFVLIHQAPLQCLNFINFIAWGLSGLVIYRLCLIVGTTANAAFLTCSLILASAGVFAQATTTTPDLTFSTTLLCAVYLLLRCRETGQTRYKILAGLATGLAVGSDPRASWLFVVGLFVWLIWVAKQPATRNTFRPWIGPLTLAFGLGMPFAAINLANGEWGLAAIFGRPAITLSTDILAGWWSWRPPLPGVSFNEDTAGFGLTGLLLLVGAGYCIRHQRVSTKRVVWAALAWIAATLLCHRLSLRPRDLTFAVFVLSPCLAFWFDVLPRRTGRLLLPVVLILTLYGAGLFLFKNTSRPLDALLHASIAPPGRSSLPLLVEHRMKGQPHINVDTDDSDEEIFPFMMRAKDQRFTSHRDPHTEAYQFISRSIMGRNAAYSTLSRCPAYIMVPMETKRTAGVEFLATIGSGASARDYFGLLPHAADTAPITSNRALLVSLYTDPDNKDLMKIRLAGLNPSDQANLVVELQHDDRSTTKLGTLRGDGETKVAITQPFRFISFRIVDNNTGADIGNAAIEHLASNTNTQPIDPTRPTSDSSLFVTDLVLSRDNSLINCEGLLPVEGPFPQWDIPYIRWARVPVVRLTIPPVKQLVHLQLSYSLRLHVRKAGSLEVFFNGRLVKYHALEGQLNWVDQTLDLEPQFGENVLEFRDATFKSEPDWLDYLERYPDVMAYVEQSGIPLALGALEHYETHGKSEGRTVKQRQTDELERAYEDYYYMFRNLRLEGFKNP